MSDLTAFRDHCRRMATAARTGQAVKAHGHDGAHRRALPPVRPPAADADLWQQLADQVDAYLAGDPSIVQTTTPTDADVPLDLEEPA